ncbi:MAG: PspA/IM30 family protein, partial [Desulfobacterales bacterium]|nr:PspA/IM30 family protein [Desulfobacterales bacterium]
IASQKKVQRLQGETRDRELFWDKKATLAVTKGRDDLARQALLEKRKFTQRLEAVAEELMELGVLVEQYRDDIQELEERLKSAREKQRLLVQRHIRATRKKQAHQEIRRADSNEVLRKFEEMENHIERMEAEADLVNYGRKSSLEAEFEELSADDDIEAQLRDLKSSQSRKNDDTNEA